MKKMENFNDNKILKLKLLNIIRNEGPSTKQKLAEKLGLNITTISNLVNNLCIRHKFLTELGEDTSSGGRKPKIYQINGEYGHVVGINIGARNTVVLISDILGDVISSIIEKTDFNKSGEEIINKVAALTDRLISETNINRKSILGYGIGVYGCIDTSDGYVILCPNINGLKGLPLKKIFESRFNNFVFIDDSVRCMAIAEKKLGHANGYDNFIFVSVGKGIGSGIYIDGKIYRGSTGVVGELGHITVKEDGPVCNCGNMGCVEAIASEPGIIKRVIEGMDKGIFTSIPRDNITIEAISMAAEEGDKFAYNIINKTGEYIGIAISTALNLFGSHLVVLGGTVSSCGEILFSAIERTVKLRALETISKKVKIKRTELDTRIPAIGAAINMINEIFTDPSMNIIERFEITDKT